MSALLHAKELLTGVHTPSLSPQWLQQATSLADALVKDLFLTIMYVQEKRSQVQLCQRTLQALFDKVVNVTDSREAQQKISSSIKFIRDQLPEYFNWEEKAIVAKTKAKQLTKFLLHTQHHHQLSASIYNIFVTFVQHSQLTWRHYAFLKQLLKTGTESTNILIPLLQFNIVDPPVLTTITQHWQQELTHTEDPLTHLRSLILQLNNCHSVSHLYNSVPLYDKLSLWLNDEYTFLINNVTKTSALQTDRQTLPGCPLHTSLSVAQLAALTRIIVEAGIISCNNQKQLFALLANNIRTAGTSAISPQSFRNKYYVPEAATISAVKDICIRMLNEARKLA